MSTKPSPNPKKHNADPQSDIDQASGWFDQLIQGSIRLRGWIMLLMLGLVALGIWSYLRLPIDAVPDITNVQVQINSDAVGYTTPEVEQQITYPIETAMGGLPKLAYTRSISRYGLSQVTVVFEDGTDIYFARQMIAERLQEVSAQLPEAIEPTMSPVSTGLGEIFQWALVADPAARREDGQPYTATDLRELQDWVVRPQLRLVSGVAEVNTIGGLLREYQVVPQRDRLAAVGLNVVDLVEALQRNNLNRGAGFVERNGQQITVRSPARYRSLEDIRNTPVASPNGRPILLSEVADVQFGQALRTGAATYDGQETVLGTVMMLMGANSRDVAQAVVAKIPDVQRSLPKGIKIVPLYDRTDLVDRAIATVQKNLSEGALLVVAVLFAFLGNFRAALITACVIPLSMLWTLTGMQRLGISANLMSLGALDFGIIVDGAVVIVENSIRHLAHQQVEKGRLLTRSERFAAVFTAAKQARRPLIYGQLIILTVYLPIFALTGVEGKMFHPMAATVVLALLGAMILSVTFVPAAIAMFVTGKVQEKEGRVMRVAHRIYDGSLAKALQFKWAVLGAATLFLVLVAMLIPRLGSEFVPTLSEGDLAVQALRAPSTALNQSVSMQQRLERELLRKIPEISHVYARTGTAEVASDPMPVNISDAVVSIKPQHQWPDPSKSRDQLRAEVEAVVNAQVGSASELSQPIELRFNELLSGVRSDLGVKVFGDDLVVLKQIADKIATQLQGIEGASSVNVEQVQGLPMISVEVKRDVAARYGLSAADIQDSVASRIGGMTAGVIFEGDRQFDLVVRDADADQSPEQLAQMPIPLPDGGSIMLGQVAHVEMADAPAQISRENGKRRVVVSVNVNNRDLGSFVADVQKTVRQVPLPAGYWVDYGGQFENLQSAQQRLTLIVPLVFLLVGMLLYAMFGRVKDCVMVLTGIPFALTGGVLALWLRDIPFSVSAGVGFIALSGVAVLNGLVMLSFINELRHDQGLSVRQAVYQGALLRLRPVLMTALVASLGFVPMALATGTGSEVQRPLATVVIGGIMSSTLLTLLVLPVLYQLWYGKPDGLKPTKTKHT